jgi:hypothetical protein
VPHPLSSLPLSIRLYSECAEGVHLEFGRFPLQRGVRLFQTLSLIYLFSGPSRDKAQELLSSVPWSRREFEIYFLLAAGFGVVRPAAITPADLIHISAGISTPQPNPISVGTDRGATAVLARLQAVERPSYVSQRSSRGHFTARQLRYLRRSSRLRLDSVHIATTTNGQQALGFSHLDGCDCLHRIQTRNGAID